MVKNESDPVREQIQERFFGGNDPISQVMNQTVKDVVNNKINMSNSTTHQQLSELNDRQQINRQSENNVMLQDNGGNDQGVPIDVIMGLNKNYKAILKKADKIANQMYRPNNPDKSVGSRASLQKFDKTVEDTYVNRYEKE